MRDTFPLMIFAAGFGTRMRHLTADRPKPLVPVRGTPLLDRALALGQEAGCAPVVVNTHYRGQMIADHLAGRGALVSHEPEILETGGGMKRAAPLLGPVAMTLNPDAVWRGGNPLQALQAAWDPDRMDALLLVQDMGRVKGREGKSDFVLDAAGRLSRAEGRPGVLYLGAQILKTAPVVAWPEDVFSLYAVWVSLIQSGRCYGLSYDGQWCDVGSPEGLAEAEAMLDV